MGVDQALLTCSMKYREKASAPVFVCAVPTAGTLAVVGECDAVVGAVVLVVGEGAVVLEGDTSGLVSPPHPDSNIDAARGTASRPAEVFFTVPPTVLRAERGQVDDRRFFG